MLREILQMRRKMWKAEMREVKFTVETLVWLVGKRSKSALELFSSLDIDEHWDDFGLSVSLSDVHIRSRVQKHQDPNDLIRFRNV